MASELYEFRMPASSATRTWPVISIWASPIRLAISASASGLPSSRNGGAASGHGEQLQPAKLSLAVGGDEAGINEQRDQRRQLRKNEAGEQISESQLQLFQHIRQQQTELDDDDGCRWKRLEGVLESLEQLEAHCKSVLQTPVLAQVVAA